MPKRSKRNTPAAAADAESTQPFHNPFGALGDLSSQLPEAAPLIDTGSNEAATESGAQPEATPAPPAATWSVGGKVVLRRERKGHGGKTATVIDGMVLRGISTADFARTLGKHLGCAARLDGQRVVLAGDQRQRAAALLQKHGARQLIQA